ncbi:hypothetical protein U1Q18_017988, partial [Sarracenia purpurea var. burkii]
WPRQPSPGICHHSLWVLPTNPLHHMTHFPVEESFLATCNYAKMGINLLLGRRLGSHFGPFETPVPHLVRLFYQNMHRDYRTDGFGRQTEHLITHVDSYDIEVVPHILARAANIFGTEDDVACDERAPISDTIQPADMALAVSEGRSPRGSAITRHRNQHISRHPPHTLVTLHPSIHPHITTYPPCSPTNPQSLLPHFHIPLLPNPDPTLATTT